LRASLRFKILVNFNYQAVAKREYSEERRGPRHSAAVAREFTPQVHEQAVIPKVGDLVSNHFKPLSDPQQLVSPSRKSELAPVCLSEYVSPSDIWV
jgi:hypothetical protein